MRLVIKMSLKFSKKKELEYKILQSILKRKQKRQKEIQRAFYRKKDFTKQQAHVALNLQFQN